ncbi:nicotinamidase-related amidase [Naumannella cuiyingiana]|uniref:Nicotinamidase-related amidase n=1 Tax=Naumannella cuiyingiana TaxID=1347891 RepID=A0A7Z0DA25_9ACTN|nr:cysteine hydrolase family protein [Naumannella cuiyingiana]NYI71741.1 nicotinamidase-related amidase [Naumannella cuiyingiana]
MTSLTGRPNTALLVIDMQNGVVDGAHQRAGVIDNIAALVDRARAAEVPVVWVRHSDEEMTQGSPEWQIVDELTPADGEPLVGKTYGDSFEQTDLEDVLAERGVGRVVVTGAQTDMCIRSTLHGALVRGYDALLVGDAHTTEDLRPYGVPIGPADAIAYTNAYWDESAAKDRRGGTVSTAEVDFAAKG